MSSQTLDLRLWLLNNLPSIKYLTPAYKILVTLSFALFICFSVFYIPAIFSKIKTNKICSFFRSEFIYVTSISIFIFMARWPGFLASALNPDEPFFIAGAIKLVKDPIFWRSVDTTTSGPLNIFPLILPTLLGLKIEYASARLIGLILIIISTIFLYFSIRSIYDVAIARLAIIPTVTTVALMTYFDYVHYSSEHVSIAILSTLLLIVCQFYNSNLNKPRGTAFFLGFLVGMIPYAKLQAAPIGMIIALVFLHILWKKNPPRKQFLRSLLSLVLGGLLFSSFVFLLLLVFSAFESFWMSYIEQNLLYASSGVINKHLTFSKKIVQFLRMLFQPSDTRVLFSLSVLSISLGFSFLIGRRSVSSKDDTSLSDTFIWFSYSLFIIAATIYSITKTGSPFTHYLLFLIIPSGFTIGIFVGELDKAYQNNLLSRKHNGSFFTTFIVGILILSSLLQVATRTRPGKGNIYINQRQQFTDNYISPVSKTILKYADVDDSMAIWGWKSELRVETGLVQATRDDSIWQISTSPNKSYFMKRYIDDLLRSNPKMFVDTVGPSGFVWYRNREFFGHEVFPEINKIVQDNYKLVDEVDGVRIYIRK